MGNKDMSPKTFLMVISLLLGMAMIMPDPAQALENYKKFYLEGLELKEKNECEKGIAIKDREKKKIRFYGMRYDEYFPHREKGICHFEIQQYHEAYTELEKLG